jgi:hypothetical protein
MLQAEKWTPQHVASRKNVCMSSGSIQKPSQDMFMLAKVTNRAAFIAVSCYFLAVYLPLSECDEIQVRW